MIPQSDVCSGERPMDAKAQGAFARCSVEVQQIAQPAAALALVVIPVAVVVVVVIARATVTVVRIAAISVSGLWRPMYCRSGRRSR